MLFVFLIKKFYKKKGMEHNITRLRGTGIPDITNKSSPCLWHERSLIIQ